MDVHLYMPQAGLKPGHNHDDLMTHWLDPDDDPDVTRIIKTWND